MYPPLNPGHAGLTGAMTENVRSVADGKPFSVTVIVDTVVTITGRSAVAPLLPLIVSVAIPALCGSSAIPGDPTPPGPSIDTEPVTTAGSELLA